MQGVLNNYRALFILIVLFLLSVLIRIPTLNRPLSKHHEFCTAVSLRIMQIWDKAGIATYNFNPVMTYPNAADKFINNYASGSGKMVDEEGNYYYVSHPPLAYYIPFFIFKALFIQPDVLPIQIFNLLLHFISAIGIYLIIFHLLKEEYKPPLCFPALAGFIFYLFSPATMWFQSNTYMPDMAVQTFFIFAVFFSLKFFESEERKHLILLSLSVFLMTYTTWLGVFFAITLIFFRILRLKKIQSPLVFITVVFLSASAAVSLTLFQYSQIAGWNSYLVEAFSRASERSGLQNGFSYFFLLWEILLQNYITSFAPLLVVVLVLSKNSKFRTSKFLNLAIVSVVPVLFLHVAFPNYSGHDFTTLYGAVFLSVAAGMGSLYFSRKGIPFFVGAMAIYILISTGQYYFINRPGPISQRGERYADSKDIGILIKQNSIGEEVVFLLNEKPTPEEIFYAGRNILQIANEDEAIVHLHLSPAKEGVIFRKSGNNKIEVVKRISE